MGVASGASLAFFASIHFAWRRLCSCPLMLLTWKLLLPLKSSYIWKIVAHFALHLTLFFLVLQPWKLLKPFFSKPTADHLPLFFVFVSWRRLLRICSSCLIFSLFSSFVAFLVNFNLFGVSLVNLTSALKTKTKETHVLFTSPHVKGKMASTVDCIIYFLPRVS